MVASGAHHTKISKAAAVFIDAGLGFRGLNVLAANGARNAVRRSWQHLSIQWAVHTLVLKQRLARWAGREGRDKGRHCIGPAKLLASTASRRGKEACGAKTVILGDGGTRRGLPGDRAQFAFATAFEGALGTRAHQCNRYVFVRTLRRRLSPRSVLSSAACQRNGVAGLAR